MSSDTEGQEGIQPDPDVPVINAEDNTVPEVPVDVVPADPPSTTEVLGGGSQDVVIPTDDNTVTEVPVDVVLADPPSTTEVLASGSQHGDDESLTHLAAYTEAAKLAADDDDNGFSADYDDHGFSADYDDHGFSADEDDYSDGEADVIEASGMDPGTYYNNKEASRVAKTVKWNTEGATLDLFRFVIIKQLCITTTGNPLNFKNLICYIPTKEQLPESQLWISNSALKSIGFDIYRQIEKFNPSYSKLGAMKTNGGNKHKLRKRSTSSWVSAARPLPSPEASMSVN
jgi:hypothetical protein